MYQMIVVLLKTLRLHFSFSTTGNELVGEHRSHVHLSW